MTLFTVFYILLVHWLADFVAQSHDQATRKSVSMAALLEHTLTYTLIWLGAISLYSIGTFYFNDNAKIPVENALLFIFITLVAHTVTDYFTSRWVKVYFTKQNFHNGFVIIGIDQILHYAQLILCFKLLIL